MDRLGRQVPEFWRQLRAAEVLLDEAAESFGEDAAIPEVRAIVVWLREELTGLHETLKTGFGQEVDLHEPDDADLDTMRKIAGWPKKPTDGQAINLRL